MQLRVLAVFTKPLLDFISFTEFLRVFPSEVCHVVDPTSLKKSPISC